VLVYSQNILSSNTLDFGKESVLSKQYINKDGKYTNCLLVNRGYGTGKYTFKYAFYSDKRKILVENHVNVITHPDKKVLGQIKKSFDDIRTKEFIENYFYNNGVSKSELLNVLPIYKEYIV
jgi:hypothetical protein